MLRLWGEEDEDLRLAALRALCNLAYGSSVNRTMMAMAGACEGTIDGDGLAGSIHVYGLVMLWAIVLHCRFDRFFVSTGHDVFDHAISLPNESLLSSYAYIHDHIWLCAPQPLYSLISLPPPLPLPFYRHGVAILQRRWRCCACTVAPAHLSEKPASGLSPISQVRERAPCCCCMRACVKYARVESLLYYCCSYGTVWYDTTRHDMEWTSQ